MVTEALVAENYSGATADWRARYEAQFGPVQSPYALYGFEATDVVLEALRRAGHAPDRAAVRAAVMGTQNFSGLLGTFSFDADGDTITERPVSPLLGPNEDLASSFTR